MNKKYIVRLTDQERTELAAVIKKLKGTSEKVRRAQILLKADADGPNWTDQRIAEAFGCRTKSVENIRQRLVERGFGDCWTAVSVRHHRSRSCSAGSRKLGSLPRDWDRLPRAMPTGHCACWRQGRGVGDRRVRELRNRAAYAKKN